VSYGFEWGEYFYRYTEERKGKLITAIAKVSNLSIRNCALGSNSNAPLIKSYDSSKIDMSSSTNADIDIFSKPFKSYVRKKSDNGYRKELNKSASVLHFQNSKQSLDDIKNANVQVQNQEYLDDDERLRVNK
jgi:hypothetical protein